MQTSENEVLCVLMLPVTFIFPTTEDKAHFLGLKTDSFVLQLAQQ